MKCSGCQWWKKDYGVWTFTGWTGMDRDDGHCHLEPTRIYKRATDVCSHYEPVIPEPRRSLLLLRALAGREGGE